MNDKMTRKCLRPMEYICGKSLVEDTGNKIKKKTYYRLRDGCFVTFNQIVLTIK